MGNDSTENSPVPPREVVGHEATGDRIAKYTLLRVRGQGSFGVVWEALEDPPLARRVAIKILLSGFSPEALARFEREGPILATLKHPGIAEVLDTGRTPHGHPYQVLELIEGDPLDRVAATLAEPDKLELFAKVCDAVAFANARGIVHRDLKPSNILVTSYDNLPVPKLIDFGIAKQLSAPTDARGVTLRGQALGTLEYMSPEQAQGVINLDARSDVFALGVILCELITGKTPFTPSQGESDQQALLRLATQHNIRTPRTLRKDVARDLETIILRATDITPARRYATAADVAADVRRFIQGEPIAGSRDSTLYTASRDVTRWMRRNTAMTGAIVALLATLLGTFIYSPLFTQITPLQEVVSDAVFVAPKTIDPLRSVRIVTLDDDTSPEDLAALAAKDSRNPALAAALSDVQFDDQGSLRLLHAELFTRLAAAQPRAVAVDIAFRLPREREDPFLIQSFQQLATARVPLILAAKTWPAGAEDPELSPTLLAAPGVRWGAVEINTDWSERIAHLAIARKVPQRRADPSFFLQAYSALQQPHAFADVTIDVEAEGVRLTYWKPDATGRRDTGQESFLRVDGIAVNDTDTPHDIVADWKLVPPRSLSAFDDASWSYARALEASPEQLADFCRDHIIIIGDRRRILPAGDPDYPLLARADLPGPYVVAHAIEQLVYGKPTRVPNRFEGPLILAAMACMGVFVGSRYAKRPRALALALVTLTVTTFVLAIIIAHVFDFECGPFIPAITLLTAGLTAALVFSRLQPLRLLPATSLSRL